MNVPPQSLGRYHQVLSARTTRDMFLVRAASDHQLIVTPDDLGEAREISEASLRGGVGFQVHGVGAHAASADLRLACICAAGT